jgi:glycosyltransferase involved in cell wall biosynthesis
MQPIHSPVVSIIIIVFNGAKYIHTAIESVFRQTFQDFEIVVVDDGSTDNIKEVLEPWIKKGKVYYFYQQNKGVSGAYNTGVRMAKGQYIKFLDCDDWIYPQQLEKQVNHLQGKSESIISVTDYEFEFENKNRKSVKVWLESNQLAQFIEDNQCPCHAILINRSLINKAGGYDEELSAYEDSDLWIRCLLHGGFFERVEYTGCCYRILGGSVSSDSEKMFRQRSKFHEKLNRNVLPQLNQLHNKVLARLLLSNIRLIHMCLARDINPLSFIPMTFQTSRMIYGIKIHGIRRLFLKIVGFKNITALKYLRNCLLKHGYRDSLLKTIWREE